jgi:ABC-type antimicrobial peptide transport system permease subunit
MPRIVKKEKMAMSRVLKATMLIVIIVVAVFGIYAAVTFPKTVVSFPVSFTIGAETKTEEFDVPWLHGLIQVEIKVQSGTALWYAEMTSGDEKIWSHSAAQGGQTTYTSEWTEISAARYNFTFKTLGIGSLEGEIKVTTKGGFW